MRIKELPRVVGVVARFLEPYRQVGFVESLLDKFRVTACNQSAVSPQQSMREGLEPTIRWTDIGDVGVVCLFPRP